MKKSNRTNETKCHVANDIAGINVNLFANTIAKMTNVCYNTFENGGVTICFTEKLRKKWQSKKYC